LLATARVRNSLNGDSATSFQMLQRQTPSRLCSAASRSTASTAASAAIGARPLECRRQLSFELFELPAVYSSVPVCIPGGRCEQGIGLIGAAVIRRGTAASEGVCARTGLITVAAMTASATRISKCFIDDLIGRFSQGHHLRRLWPALVAVMLAGAAGVGASTAFRPISTVPFPAANSR
jgi:hypothetical protein